MLPRATKALLLINAVAFIFQTMIAPQTALALALWPPGTGFAPWQLITYGFLHGNLAHLTLNMFAIYMFGAELERVWGAKRFLAYFLACVVTAGCLQSVVTGITGSLYPTVGASGGLFGLLLAFAMYFPNRVIVPLFPPIPMPAWLFVTLYGTLELVLGVMGTESGIAHFAHLGGMLGGYLLLRHWHKRS